MNFNLTDNQKELARWIHEMIKKGELPETFRIAARGRGKVWIDTLGDMKGRDGPMNWDQADSGAFHALCADGLLIVNPEEESAIEMAGRRIVTRRAQDALTVTGKFYQAVNSNFIEEVVSPPISTLAQPHPPEIALSIDRLRTKFPDPKKLGFLVMRFAAAKPFQRIVEIIKETAIKHGVVIVRADENEFHSDLWGNVRTHLHGCGFGIAVYERIETQEPNANVGLEVGYLMAMNKPVLLLKDKTVQTLQADLAGKLYRQFDPHDPEGTLPDQVERWLKDNGIVISAS